jgi:hypothetical protein
VKIITWGESVQPGGAWQLWLMNDNGNGNGQNTETTDHTKTTRINPSDGEAGAADGIAFD